MKPLDGTTGNKDMFLVTTSMCVFEKIIGLLNSLWSLWFGQYINILLNLCLALPGDYTMINLCVGLPGDRVALENDHDVSVRTFQDSFNWCWKTQPWIWCELYHLIHGCRSLNKMLGGEVACISLFPTWRHCEEPFSTPGGIRTALLESLDKPCLSHSHKSS